MSRHVHPRSRPLRCEDPDHLFFVTTRTLEEVFWLHPLLCSKLEPVNREARRVVGAKRARLRARLERLVVSANRRRPENQPNLTVEEAEKLAEGLVSSALARAQEYCAKHGLPPVEVFAVVVMSNEDCGGTFHHCCPGPRINGGSVGAMNRHA